MDFDTITKIAKECGRFGQFNCCQSSINRQTWSHWSTLTYDVHLDGEYIIFIYSKIVSLIQKSKNKSKIGRG